MKTLHVVVAMLLASISFAQTPWYLIGNAPPGSGNFIGTTNAEPFEIKTTNTSTPQPINFYTGGNPQVTITAVGDVGIGTQAPGHKVDVHGGDINVNDDNFGYRIGTEYVLWHNSTPSSIYVGVGAGASSPGVNNTFVGNDAGTATTSSGYANTFLGFQSGLSNEIGRYNTFTGFMSGVSNTEGNHNCFYGKKSGSANVAGSANCYYGDHSGEMNVSGSSNVFIGGDCAKDMPAGDYNVLIGFNAAAAMVSSKQRNVYIGNETGFNAEGDNNTLIGNFANAPSGVDYGTAIGTNAYVAQDYSLVLGAINGQNGWSSLTTKVGIGTTAPAKRLEIVDGTSGNSGLRLTSLTTSATPVSNPGTGVLSVNSFGDVIYVTGGGGSGTVSTCGTQTTNWLTKFCGTTPNIQNSLVFDNGTNVGIGVTSSFGARFDVLNSSPISSVNNAIRGRTTYTGTISSICGVLGSSSLTGSAISNVGVAGTAPNSSGVVLNVGVSGGQTVSSNQLNIGVWGNVDGNNKQNVGGLFIAGDQCVSNSSPVNIGVYGRAAEINLNGDAKCNDPGIAGYFQGAIIATNHPYSPSDIHLKDSIDAISGALSVISMLKPKHYVFKTDSFPYMQLPVGRHFGFLSQEIDTILPELAIPTMQPAIYDTAGNMLMDTMGFMGLAYTEFIPIAIAGIQEQQAIIDTIRGEAVTADATGVTDTNRVVKWSLIDRKLTNSLLYDDGSRLGLPTVEAGSFFNVQNTGGHSVGLNVGSTDTSTIAVVRARYTNNGGSGTAAGVSGYSKYTNAASDDDGIGGRFEGGKWGSYSLSTGANYEGIGLLGESKNATNRNQGVLGAAISPTTADNFGVVGRADSSEEANGGVIGVSEYENATSVNIGLSGFAGGSSHINAAGEFEAWDTAGVNYGIFAYANGSAPDAYAGYFDGDVHATGTVTWASDATLKQQIQDVNCHDALSIISQLQPKTYNFRCADYPYLSLPQGTQYGLLAQEVEQVLPVLVKDVIQPERRDSKGNVVSPQLEYKGLNYAGLIPVLIGAVKEQQVKIDSLNDVITNRLTELENRLNGCCGTGESNKTDGSNAHAPNQFTVELSNTQVVVLEQNVPNPFAEQTSISYFIPENTGRAQMVFTDVLGNNIQSVEVKSGYGTVTVFASNLTSGQYSYSLVIDGKAVETKRMVKTK